MVLKFHVHIKVLAACAPGEALFLICRWPSSLHLHRVQEGSRSAVLCVLVYLKYLCVIVCMCMHMQERVYGEQRRALNALQQEFQKAVSHPILLLGAKLRASAKAAMLLTIEPSLSLQLSRT